MLQSLFHTTRESTSPAPVHIVPDQHGRSRPAVSVVIPAFNGEDVIGETIQSVLSQTFTDFELIVVDDASTDGTVTVVSQFRDPRLTLVRNSVNLGFEGNFNRALDLAAGRFVKVLPMDDLLYPSCLERQVAILEAPENQQVCLVSCAKDIITHHGRTVLRGRKGFSGWQSGMQIIRRTARAGTNIVGEPGSVLFRSSVLSQAGRFDGTIPFIMDLDLWCRMLLHGDAYLVPETLSAFRIRPQSMSMYLAGRQTQQLRDFLRRLHSQPRFGIRRTDVLIGSCRAWVNTILRMGVYRAYLS